MAWSRLLKSWAMPPATWPSAVSFSDWCICVSSSRWDVMSRTMARRPSTRPSRPGTPESVTARLSILPSARLAVRSKVFAGRTPVRAWRAACSYCAGNMPTSERPMASRAHHPIQGTLGLRHLAVEPRVADGHREGVREHLEQLALARIDGSRARPVGDDQVAHDGGVIADGTDDGALGLHAFGQELAQDHLGLVVAE